MFAVWIMPSLVARGLTLERSEISQALILLIPSMPPTVHINSEAELVAVFAAATRDISPGEPITGDDVTELVGIRPREDPGDSGWLAFATVGSEIIVGWDGRRNRKSASRLVDRAREFLACAIDSVSNGRLAPAVECAFAAAELGVKADMFLMFDRPTTKHWERANWWSEWERLGNAPDGTASTLSRLYSERPSARYAESQVNVDPAEMSSLLESVSVLIEHVAERIAVELVP